jgi:DNA primase
MIAEQGVSVQELKARASILEVVRRFVNLRQNGGRWVGPCPFHQETKPSFSVNEEEGFFYCFGCQAHGDVIDFYCKINGLEFKEGVNQLAAEMGLTLAMPSGQSTARSRQEKDFSRLCLEMYALSQSHFRRNLGVPEGRACLEYLRNRGLSMELAQAFGLGCGLPGWDHLSRLLKAKGYDQGKAVEAGLLIRNERRNSVYDRFRNRLIFPIENLSSQVIAFGGRVITSEDEPKYINSSDSAIYKKGDHLYGLSQARRVITQEKRALLTEGYMDVLTLHQFGYGNACGVLGTSLTMQQIKRLSGFCTQVDLLFDGDRAGRKAALRSARMLLTRGLGCRVALLPDGEDVDSLLRGAGKGAFDALLAAAEDGLDYCLRVVRETGSAKEIVEWAKAFAKELLDPSLLSFFLPKLARGLELDEIELRNTVIPLAMASKRPQTVDTPAPSFGGGGKMERMPRSGHPDVHQKQERDLLGFAIRCPHHVPRLDAAGASIVLVSPWSKSLWKALLEAQGGELLPFLGEEEKGFYIQCRLQATDQDVDEQIELEEICSFLDKLRHQEKHRSMLAALRGRQGREDQDDLELLRALQESLGRNNGEH